MPVSLLRDAWGLTEKRTTRQLTSQKMADRKLKATAAFHRWHMLLPVMSPQPQMLPQ